MNPLGNNSNNGLSPQIRQQIQQVKQMRNMFGGNFKTMAQQNPMVNQVMQMCNGKNPEQVFMNMCQQRGLDPQAILNELQN